MTVTQRALVVEDDPAAAQMLRGALQSMGWAVVAADVCDTVQGAIVRWSHGPRPGLVVVDQYLHGMLKGADFVGILRDTKAGEHVPVVVVSGIDFGHELRGRIRELAGVLLAKPFGFGDLRRAIEVARARAETWQRLPPLESDTATFRRLQAIASERA